MAKVRFVSEITFTEGEVDRKFQIIDSVDGMSCLMIGIWKKQWNGIQIPSCAMAWIGKSFGNDDLVDNKIFDQTGEYTFEEVLTRLGYQLIS